MRFYLLSLFALFATGCYSGLENRRALFEPRFPIETPSDDAENAIVLLTPADHLEADDQVQRIENEVVVETDITDEEFNKEQRLIDLIESTEDLELRRLLASKLTTTDSEASKAIGKSNMAVEESTQGSCETICAEKKTQPVKSPEKSATADPTFIHLATFQQPAEEDDKPKLTQGIMPTVYLEKTIDPGSARLGSVAKLKVVNAKAVDAKEVDQTTVVDSQSDALGDFQSSTNQPKELKNTVQPKSFQPAKALPGKWKQELHSTIGSLEKSLYLNNLENDDQATLQIYLRLLHLISNNKHKATQEIPELSGKDQAYWTSQMKALTTLLDQDCSDQQSATFQKSSSAATDHALNHLRHAIQQLACEADLQIHNLTLCREVTGLGQIDEFETYEFSKQQPVLIYCELENFISTPVTQNGKILYESDLKGSLKILNNRNQTVYQHEYSTVHDSARRQRRDFYMYFPMTIPNLPIGEYQVHLEIEDVKGSKIGTAEKPLQFSVK